MEEHTITVKVADKHGFTQYMLNPAQTLEMIQSSSLWIFADNVLVRQDGSPPRGVQVQQELNEEYLSTVSCVRILPGLVGGPTSSPQAGEEE